MLITCLLLLVGFVVLYFIGAVAFVFALLGLAITFVVGAVFFVTGLFPGTQSIAAGAFVFLVVVFSVTMGLGLLALICLFSAGLVHWIRDRLGCAAQTGGFFSGFIGGAANPWFNFGGCGCTPSIPLPPPPPGIDPARWAACVAKCIGDKHSASGNPLEDAAQNAWNILTGLRDQAQARLDALKSFAEQHPPGSVPGDLKNAIAGAEAQTKSYGAAAQSALAATGAAIASKIGL